jgi:uncharacterized protein YbjT (DUF2867 family)
MQLSGKLIPVVMSTAFVAGASGYTGREVVRALAADGARVVAHVRPDSPRRDELVRELGADGATVDVTAWDAAAMTRSLTTLSPTVVFALLGTTRARANATRKRGGAEESYDSVDYGLTSLLLRASVACGSAPRFVYLSALGAGRPSSNAYFAARYKAETEVRASGLEYVIARPSFITGPDRAESRPTERLAAGVSDAVLGLVGHLGAAAVRDRYASMSARTLGKALVELALDEKAKAVVAEPAELRSRG